MMMNNNNDEHLKKMLETATQKVDETINESQKESKGPSRKVVSIAIGAMLVFGILLYIGSIGLRPQEFEDKTDNPDWVESQVEKEKAQEEVSMWQFEYPVKLPDWSKQPYNVKKIIEDEKVYDELIKFANQFPDIMAYTAWMPSSTQGDWEGAPPAFTNNVYEQYLENGEVNPHYSYVLKEDYLIAYSTYVQRLLNPTFGDWIFAQRYEPVKPLKDNSTFEVLKDMFSNEWWNANIHTNQDYSALPIMVDWEGDNFGGLEFAERVPSRYGTFFGVVDVDEESEKIVIVDSLGQDDRGAEILKINTPVKYVAFGVNDNLIELQGNLVITLGSNPNSSSINRIIITNAELVLK